MSRTSCPAAVFLLLVMGLARAEPGPFPPEPLDPELERELAAMTDRF